jgi:hypothetical protein
LAWEEAEHLERVLRRINIDYQVGAERRMFSSDELPVYRFVLLKWSEDPILHARIRKEVFVTDDIQQMISALKMLISVEKEG